MPGKVQFLLIILKTLQILGLASQNHLRIMGGTDADISKYPYMVSLQQGGHHFCGGTILNEKFILTAAHCVCNNSPANITAVVNYTLKSAKEIPVVSIICHDYNVLEHVNDVALLELQLQIPNKNFVQLVEANFSTESEVSGLLLGWGLITTSGSRPEILQKVEVIVYNDSTCRRSHFAMYDMERNMCAGWPQDGRGSCQGDSGGPLLVNSVQVGVISFGVYGDCGISNPDQPKVLTRISAYLQWIYNNSRISDGNYSYRETSSIFIVIFLNLLSIVF